MNLEQLTSQELELHVSRGTLRLAFVGVSNCGKSYRSRVLQNEYDFFWYEVDAHIQKQLNIVDMNDISEWLGYPTTDTYTERAQQYLEAEEKCTYLKNLDIGEKNLVFDTTGSVVYLPDKTKDWLYSQCLIVHIDVGEDSVTEMSVRYFKEPKPVLWGDVFNQQEGERDEAALRRCYPKLLKSRLRQYRSFAHISIPAERLFDADSTKTLSVISSYLNKSKR